MTFKQTDVKNREIVKRSGPFLIVRPSSFATNYFVTHRDGTVLTTQPTLDGAEKELDYLVTLEQV